MTHYFDASGNQVQVRTATPMPVTGLAAAASAVDGSDVTIGATTDVANQDPTTTGTLMAFFKGLLGLVGIKTETAPASDTASSGVNGRLQRIAQRLTTLLSGIGLQASATFTPAAASHTSGDVNGAAGTFALAAPSGCLFCITDIELLINSDTAETPVWRLYLYNVTPPSALADDTAFDLPSGDQASFLGYIDIGLAVDLGSTQWVQTTNINRCVKLSGTSLFGYLVNVGTSTPAAVAHTVTIKGVPV